RGAEKKRRQPAQRPRCLLDWPTCTHAPSLLKRPGCDRESGTNAAEPDGSDRDDGLFSSEMSDVKRIYAVLNFFFATLADGRATPVPAAHNPCTMSSRGAGFQPAVCSGL